jgi:WD40 repeat protein
VLLLIAIALGWWWTRPQPPPSDVARRLPVESNFRSNAMFSINGEHLAVGSGTGAVDFWRTRDWTASFAAPLTQQPITCLAATPDGHLLAGTLGERAIVWKWMSMEARMISPLPEIPTSMAAHPTKTQIAVGLKNGKIWRLDTSDGVSSMVDAGHVGAVTGLAFGADGAWLASTGADGTVRVRWDGPEKKSIVKTEHAASAAGLAVSGERALTVDWHGEIRLWNTRDWSVLRRDSVTGGKEPDAKAADGRARSEDSGSQVALTDKIAAVGTFAGRVLLLSPATGERIREIACGYPVQALALSRDSRYLVTAGPEAFVDVRELSEPK